MIKYKIVDNFLEKEEFDKLKNFMFGRDIVWFYTDTLNYEQDNKSLHTYLEHHFFNLKQPGVVSPFLDRVNPLLEKIKWKSIMRVKGNLYPRTNKIEIHSQHRDYPFSHKGCLFSLNTCDGATVLKDGTKINSIENRMLFFNPYYLHSSTSTTNSKARMNININYF